eukprot:CAMPEP_0177548064 /NCGR_PEP_ID=MMETSP0369-20130122/64236_1 /TAXON_ID=447022 ORGANISM="Scrippsiella hangoei-like, Strain SHHI-4" /NCGR_SAMPLE_ID=MMETSP0369 /ASSEMBLY_ACC=CAM_ASM_000364 /LENGTH=79 /DNA_ID=CAMNT_0019032967 /DNA_START=527 /DNA_END=764 /DNA_ORIENTATION=-
MYTEFSEEAVKVNHERLFARKSVADIASVELIASWALILALVSSLRGDDEVGWASEVMWRGGLGILLPARGNNVREIGD